MISARGHATNAGSLPKLLDNWEPTRFGDFIFGERCSCRLADSPRFPRCLGVSAAGCLPAQNRARRACARAIPFAPTSRGSHVLAGHTDQPPQHSSQRQPCGSVRAKRLAHLTQSNRSRARSVHLRTARPHRCKIRSTAAACNHGRQRLQDATLRMLFRVLSACKAPPRAPRRGGGRARRQPAYGRDITAPDLRRTSAVSAERTASQLAAC